MKNLSFTIIFIFTTCFTYSQKVDIDNYRVEFEVANFPHYYTPEDLRTFSVEVRGSQSLKPRIDVNKIILYGFQRVDRNGTIKLIIDADEIKQGTPEKITRVDEKKDKEGNVTSRTEYYSYRSVSKSRCSISMYGPKSEKEAAKAELKKSKEEAKKADNPFLRSADNRNSSAADAGANYSLYEVQDLPIEYDYKGSESSSDKSAMSSYNTGISGAFNSFLVKLPEDVILRAGTVANDKFGYFPSRQGWQKMKILDTKDHPEYKTFQQAAEAAKVIFKNLKYNSDMESFKSDFDPILSYFVDLSNKLSASDKNQKKLKAAALYNVAMIHCTLDQFDESLAACKKMITDGQDKGDAEDMVDKIFEIKPLMEKHQTKSRHIKGF